MARVPYLSKEDLPDEDQDLLKRPINYQKAMVNNPRAYRQFANIGMWFRFESTLDPWVREAAIVQVGYATGSAYEFSHHLKISPTFGLSLDDVDAIIAETKGAESKFEPLQAAVLKAARELTLHGEITDETWAKLEEGFDTAHLIELVLLISFYNHFQRVLSALKIDVEPEYAQLLAQYDPPDGFDTWI
jgi:alkylhydroperoxidase family enzyme